MILVMLILALVSVASLLATLLMGLDVIDGNHILWAIFAVPFGLFVLTLHMFYFIGTGSDIKKVLAKEKIDPQIGNPIIWQTKLMKKRLYPILMWAMMFQMATFVLGGAVGGGMLPPAMHLALGCIAILTTVVALVLSHVMARRTFYLLLPVATLVGASAGAGDDASKDAS
jgi:hypothetical protein